MAGISPLCRRTKSRSALSCAASSVPTLDIGCRKAQPAVGRIACRSVTSFCIDGCCLSDSCPVSRSYWERSTFPQSTCGRSFEACLTATERSTHASTGRRSSVTQAIDMNVSGPRSCRLAGLTSSGFMVACVTPWRSTVISRYGDVKEERRCSDSSTETARRSSYSIGCTQTGRTRD
jgi:hypothetical protein